MNTIIVATDFSREAENAMEYAGALAKNVKAKLILFNSASLPHHTSNSLISATAIFRLEEKSRMLLQERAANLQERFKVEVGVETGFLTEIEDRLENLFVKHKAELVVMGMASQSIEQDLFGNTTTSAILKHSYPVLAVPASVTYKRIENVLFACDDMKKVDAAILGKIKQLNRLLGSKLEVLHVEDTPVRKKHVRVVPEEIPQLKDVDYIYKNYNSEDVIFTIKEEIQRLEADLLIMIPRRYGFWESLIHRSKTRLMASGLFIPLLSIPQVD